MTPLDLLIDGHHLEAQWHGTPAATALVMLHEGLGCVALWRTWPAELHARTGLPVLVYSRLGYGQSDPVSLPRPLRYMHDEALDVLPRVLDAAGITRALLLGHSDGGSIALIHAGSPAGSRVAGLALLAPHVFCEPLSVQSIAAARDAYLQGDLRQKLARSHRDVDGAFWGWNRAWLDPDFLRWNLEAFLPNVTAPVLVVQGLDDVYGTLAQVDAIERGVKGPFTRLLLPNCGHSPQRDRPAETTDAVVQFVTTCR